MCNIFTANFESSFARASDLKINPETIRSCGAALALPVCVRSAIQCLLVECMNCVKITQNQYSAFVCVHWNIVGESKGFGWPLRRIKNHTIRQGTVITQKTHLHIKTRRTPSVILTQACDWTSTDCTLTSFMTDRPMMAVYCGKNQYVLLSRFRPFLFPLARKEENIEEICVFSMQPPIEPTGHWTV